jgi:RNA 2',3'-cyclic 3'-phosphodiesterase
MRLFVAIALPASAAGELDRVVTPERPAWPGLRWTGRGAWHLTLAFLGEVDEALIPELGRRLEGGARRHSQLALSLAGAGAFPTPLRARVLWTGVQGDRRGLGKLAETVAADARRAGVAVAEERRGYQPHLTLARCRVPLDVRPLVERLAGFAGTAWVAEEIYLIHSRLGAQPRYETLGSWPLRRPRPPRPSRGPAPEGCPALDGGPAVGSGPALDGGPAVGSGPAPDGGPAVGSGPAPGGGPRRPGSPPGS